LGARSDVSRLLTSADVFLLTSISEGIPLTIIEAMVAGLPVVSTSVGGVPEVVEHEKTGLLAPARDPASLAEAILRLADDRALSHSMGTEGQLRARSHFSDARMNASYARMYEEMLGA
jgi:glycosyltransferase involved in cell wall biosynthesis